MKFQRVVFLVPVVAVAGAMLVGLARSAASGEKAEKTSDASHPAVKLEKLNWAKLQPRLSNKNAKYTMVDAWSTTCGPCMANFPHVVEMNRKYGDKGLSVISLSLDDPTDPAAVAAAEKFLKKNGAVFTNVLLDEEFGVGYDKLDINGIPAVFLFGPDGKEIRRFTMDDPNNQFTYDDVEKAVARLVGGTSS